MLSSQQGLVRLVLWILISSVLVVVTNGFCSSSTIALSHHSRYRWLVGPRCPLNNKANHQVDDDVEKTNADEEEIRSMSVRAIKLELDNLGVSSKDLFEKEDLVQRLVQARRKKDLNRGSTSSSSSSSSNTRIQTNNLVEAPTFQVPLYLTSMDSQMRVAAVNVPGGGGITVESTSQYATIQVQLPQQQSSSSTSFPTLSLLLDTACSGIVLRPQVVERYNLPRLSTPITMTGAGGTSSSSSSNGGSFVSQISFRLLGNTNKNEDETMTLFGPMAVAIQDIGALPSSLDGIMGLSFLSQFHTVGLDFCEGALSLWKDPPAGPLPTTTTTTVAQSEMRVLPRLGSIYAAPVWLGSRGPVQMLVDTGAASTLLNWKGVADLGLDRSSSSISPISNMGAMGSDNVAIQLTHRLYLSSSLNLGAGEKQKEQYPGLILKRRLAIDIGRIPVLDQLQDQGIGGILGMDLMLQCDAVHLNCRGNSPLKITLYAKQQQQRETE